MAGMGVVVGVGGGVGAGRAVFGFRIGSGGRTSQQLEGYDGPNRLDRPVFFCSELV